MRFSFRWSVLLLLAALWLGTAAPAWASHGDDDDSALLVDDDDSALYPGSVPLEDRVLGGGCEDGQNCSLAEGSSPSLALLLLGAALLRRRR